MSEGFDFKMFSVRHDRCAMKVGTDGVLLGAWASGGERLLDIGTGTGIVALMMAQRFADAMVDAVEIDADAAAQAADNVARSPFAHRINVFHTSFEAFVPQHQYSAIVSNPPYFLNGLVAADGARTTARHAEDNFFEHFFRFAKRWLCADGEVSLILPAQSIEAVSREAYLKGFLLSKRILLRTTPSKSAERCLIAFAKQRDNEPQISEECLLTSEGQRSEWADELTKEFYR